MADGKPRKVILDVDVGTDDYMALLVLLNSEKLGNIKIEGIICTYGNTTVDNVCINVIRLLETLNRTDISVYRGASTPLIPPDQEFQSFHGKDGLADLFYESEPDLSVIKEEPAAVALRRLITTNPGEISLICLAALTNIALAIKLYDDFAPNIKDLWIMGGNYTARGNITAAAEFNFYIDPEAAYIVLDSISKPIFILTWETCLIPTIPLEWRFNVLGQKSNPEIQILNQAEEKVYDKEEGLWIPCDAFLAAAFLDADWFIIKKSSHNATVELNGKNTRGQIVLDHLKRKKENVTIIEEIDSEKFKELVMKL